MATPQRPHTSTRLLGILALLGCGKDAEPKRSPPPPVPDAAPVTATTDAGANQNKITITVEKPKTPGSGFAKRCAIGGPPLETQCSGGSTGIAFDKAGVLYLVNEKQLHRFKVSEPCTLAPEGEPLELPPDNPRPQPLGKGPVYMRSGGVAWEIVQTPDAIYVHDFLAGLFRVDRGKAEPACTELFGFGTLGKLGKRWLAQRKGIEELTLGTNGKCKAKSAGIDDKARNDIYVVGEWLFTGQSKLARYDGKAFVDVESPARICAITAMTSCGDGACAVDHNCPGIIQVDAAGLFGRHVDGNRLFDTRPWSIGAAATGPDGTVYLHAKHRDKVEGKEVCEAAVYAIPAATFAR